MSQKLSLKQWRVVKGYSQEKMSELMDIHINTYRAWEEKPSSIKLGNAMKLAQVLDISIDDISFLP